MLLARNTLLVELVDTTLRSLAFLAVTVVPVLMLLNR